MKIKRFTAAVLILSVLTVVLGAWAVTLTVQNTKLRSRITVLEASAFQQAADLPMAYDVNEAAAEFKGGVITVGEALAEYNQIAAYYDMMGMDAAEYAADAKQEVLEGMVEDAILRLKAQELGLYEISDADRAAIAGAAQAEFDAEVEYYMAYRYDAAKTEEQLREETAAYLAENGITLEDMISAAEQDYWRTKLYDYVTAGTSVSDEEVYALYEKQLAADAAAYAADFAQYEMDMTFGRVIAWHPEGIRRVEVVNIPFSVQQQGMYYELQAALSEGDAAKQAEIDALYQQLAPTAQTMLERARNGEDFAVLDAEAGDSYYPDGGVYVSAQSTIYSYDFRDAAMALANPGDISDPVYTDSGIAIIKYAGDVTPGPVAFEEISAHLRETCSGEAKNSAYNTQVFMWLQEAEIKYYPERF